jgi:hypothetical protein
MGSKRCGIRNEMFWKRDAGIGPALTLTCVFCLGAESRLTYVTYHLGPTHPLSRFDSDQLALLEKLNRADTTHLARWKNLIMPSRWDLDPIAYSPMPHSLPTLCATPKALVVDVPAQVFGAYEYGNLALWGPVSSGDRYHPTPPGKYYLNWNARIRISSDNDAWVMPWYFNFSSRIGLGLHQYALPGRPASHGCVRLLSCDAQWVFHWGQMWAMTKDGHVLQHGTPILIVGRYDFAGRQPWLRPDWWTTGVILPTSDLASLR